MDFPAGTDADNTDGTAMAAVAMAVRCKNALLVVDMISMF